MRNRNEVANEVARVVTSLVLFGGLAVALLGRPTDASSQAPAQGIVTAMPDYGNGGYTGADGKCHIGPPAQDQNGCINGEPIIGNSPPPPLSQSFSQSFSQYGNGGYTGADGKCHIGPPAKWQNGCWNGSPIVNGVVMPGNK